MSRGLISGAVLMSLAVGAVAHEAGAKAQEVGVIDGQSAWKAKATVPPVTVRPLVGATHAAKDVALLGTTRKARVFAPHVFTPVPLFEAVTGYTDSGLPISRYKKMTLTMAQGIAQAYLKDEAQRIREGKALPRPRIDRWAQAEKAIAEREAKEGSARTKTFILPGTTPEQSRAIHRETSGAQVQNGALAYVSHEAPGHVLYVQTQAFETFAKPTRGNRSSTTTPSPSVNRLENNRHENRNESKDPLKGSAEERLLEFFPDLKHYGPLSWAKAMIGAMVGEAFAVDWKALEALSQDHAKRHELANEADLKAKAKALTAPAEDKAMQEHAQAVFDVTRARAAKSPEKNNQGEKAHGKEARRQTFVFVSYALGDTALSHILRWASTREDVTVVMRGVPEGKPLGQGIFRMQVLASQIEPMPTVVIDPTLFTEYGIKAVPSVVVATSFTTTKTHAGEKRSLPQLLAKAEGLANDAWVLERLAQGAKGDLGQQGEIFPIDEPDMIEVLKKRALAVDWEAKKAEAIRRFWDRQTFVTLEAAREDSEREIDPTVVATAAILDAKGRPVVPVGRRVNPLSVLPYTETLLVFNPLREEERAWVKRMMVKLKDEGHYTRIMAVATQIDQARGWDGYEALTDDLDAHVYLLTPEVKRRFNLTATPSWVRADNARKVFVVSEYAFTTPKEASR